MYSQFTFGTDVCEAEGAFDLLHRPLAAPRLEHTQTRRNCTSRQRQQIQKRLTRSSPLKYCACFLRGLSLLGNGSLSKELRSLISCSQAVEGPTRGDCNSGSYLGDEAFQFLRHLEKTAAKLVHFLVCVLVEGRTLNA